MTAVVLDRPGSLFAPARAGESRTAGESLPAGQHGGGTLEGLLDAALHETRTNGSTECPVCHARMTVTRAHASCSGCGSRLS